MTANVNYTLKGYGRIDPAWMRDCFQLFKERRINIRKLLLMQNGDPAYYSMLELQFVLPSEAAQSSFLKTLEERLDSLDLAEKVLAPA
ncbi:MAG TPA: hypothetical protein V6C52_13055 [Coleofasciculaceae cyanobacterium]|jgi:hypothetical protein